MDDLLVCLLEQGSELLIMAGDESLDATWSDTWGQSMAWHGVHDGHVADPPVLREKE